MHQKRFGSWISTVASSMPILASSTNTSTDNFMALNPLRLLLPDTTDTGRRFSTLIHLIRGASFWQSSTFQIIIFNISGTAYTRYWPRCLPRKSTCCICTICCTT
ncbi:hypothetical protein FB446DRAFT_742353 [Lentinula raphanica]|nr:hypothetical protein FB446DRAFT_742353 [Lentinula raphanica]